MAHDDAARYRCGVGGSDTIGNLELEMLGLDPDIAALIAKVDAILCAALTPARRPPAPPVAGSDLGAWADRPVLSCGVRPQVHACEPVNAALRPRPTGVEIKDPM